MFFCFFLIGSLLYLTFGDVGPAFFGDLVHFSLILALPFFDDLVSSWKSCNVAVCLSFDLFLLVFFCFRSIFGVDFLFLFFVVDLFLGFE